MCYSLEVQLATSVIILASTLFYYIIYSRRYKAQKQKWALPFLNSVMLVFTFIGLHQFFEFLSLLTNNQWIYKMGLIISISSCYFLLRSLEILANKKTYSKIALIIILLVSLQILFAEMDFKSTSFYLSHNSALLWGAAWMFLFIYWHICAFKIYSEQKENRSRRTVLLYLLAVADFSFILSAIYVLAGHFLFSVNVCTDSPSIWCTFYVVQSLLIPILLSRLPHTFKRADKHTKFFVKQLLIYILASLVILVLLALILPLFNCLTWKLIFP